MSKEKREHWSGSLIFVLAAAGSAIGLGNLWKFPYITWKNGGGYFVILYLICILGLGIPIMIAEIAIGKITARDPMGAMKMLAGSKSPFRFIGFMGVVGSFIILSYYSVVAGWAMQYSVYAMDGTFAQVSQQETQIILNNVDTQRTVLSKIMLNNEVKTVLQPAPIPVGALATQSLSLEEKNLYQTLKTQFPQLLAETEKNVVEARYSSNIFRRFLDRPWLLVFWHTLIMGITMTIVLGGIRSGIEKSVQIAMPMLFLIIAVLVYNSMLLDTEFKTIKFLLHGDASKLTAHSILEAMGHAFFTLSIGMGVMMTYGSYMKKESNVLTNSLWVVGMDTGIAILACLMIFPIIFVYGMNPESGGIGILFTTLPLELKKFPMGDTLLILFYLLVVLAALTSAISLLEVVVTYLVDDRKISRKKAVLLASLLIYLGGLPSAFSVGGFLTYADNFTSQVLLPAGGLGIAIFMGYKMDLHLVKHEFELHNMGKWHFTIFRFAIRYLAPVLVFGVLLQTLYLFIQEFTN